MKLIYDFEMLRVKNPVKMRDVPIGTTHIICKTEESAEWVGENIESARFARVDTIDFDVEIVELFLTRWHLFHWSALWLHEKVKELHVRVDTPTYGVEVWFIRGKDPQNGMNPGCYADRWEDFDMHKIIKNKIKLQWGEQVLRSD